MLDLVTATSSLHKELPYLGIENTFGSKCILRTAIGITLEMCIQDGVAAGQDEATV